MLQNEYKREMEQLGPSQEELEQLYAMIEEGTTVKRAKRLGRRAAAVLMAAALCMALGITALAVSPTMQEILSQSLGSFAPYSQTVEGVSAVDQGIQVSVVRAIADESGGTAYLEIKDLTGDRLTEDTKMRYVHPIAYDPETRTLLAQMSWHGSSILDGEGNVSVTIKEIWGGENIKGLALPAELLEADNVLQTATVPEDQSCGTGDDRVVLVPGQTPRDLGVEWFTLSSMGFDELGRLHVQIKLADEYVNQLPNEGWLVSMSEIAKVLRERYPDGHHSVQGTTHRFEEGCYVDYCLQPILYVAWDAKGFPYAPKEWYQGLELTLEGWIGVRERVEGEWTLTFPVETLPERTVTVGQVVDTKLVETATFSIKGVTLRTTDTNQTRGDLSPLTVAVYLADGSHVTMTRGISTHWYEEEEPYYLATWEYPEPIDPAEVTAISLGYWYIPIDGETAQPGHWLSELPE